MRKNIRVAALLIMAGSVLRMQATINGSLATSAGTSFNQSQFVPGTPTVNPVFFVGVGSFGVFATDAEKTFALASATQTGVGTAASVQLTPLAPQAISVLNSQPAADSVLFGKVITDLQMLNGFPVVTIAGVPNVYYVMSNDGSKVLTNNDAVAIENIINDAGGNPTQEIVALAAGNGGILAAVSANGKTWNDGTTAGANRGIAVLTPNLTTPSLNVLNATNFVVTDNPVAQKLDLTALSDGGQINPVAFFGETPLANVTGQIARATLGENVEMFYHPGMQCVYVGLSNVKRDNFNLEGGTFGLFIARIDTSGGGSLVLQPVISNPTRSLLYNDATNAPSSTQNVTNRVVGFYGDGKPGLGARDNAVTVKQMRAMTTHTGNQYLIVNSEIGAGQNVTHGVYALPLVSSTDPALNGTLSAVNGAVPTFNSAPTSFDTMVNTSLPGVTVGLIDSRSITDIFVVGDTVYMSTAGTTNETAGIFASTALFDLNGNIRGWTPAQRMFGSVQNVNGMGFDAPRGDFYAITNQANQALGTDINTVRISQWGTTTSNLSDVLSQLFPASQGGLVSLNVFNADVPGMDVTSGFSMMVAVGPNQIAIIQNGTYNLNGAIPVTNFVTQGDDQNVFVIDTTQSPALAAIAPLTCAEVARTTGIDQGWLFIGGYNGVAVLSNDTVATNDGAADNTNSPAGRGWGSAAGLALLPFGENADAFPLGTDWTFKQLTSVSRNPFFNVHKLSAANGRMYVVTVDGMFFFDMVAAKFVNDPNNLGATPVNTLQEKRIGGFDEVLISDLIVLAPDTVAAHNCGVVATDKGLFASNLLEVGNSMELNVAQTNDLTLKLFALGNLSGKAPSNANILALGTDFENNNDELFLFDVPDSTQIPENLVQVPTDNVLVQFGQTRFDAVTDGALVLATLPQDRNSTDYVSLYNIGSTVSRDIDADMGIPENLTALTYVRNIVHDNASGAVMIAGDWGIRVNN